MRINTNISAMNTYSRLTNANAAKSGSLAKLSSGLRINRAGDDAAGLSISEKMKGQIGGLKQSIRNAQDGISLIQTAEGALTETHSILNRMRTLAVQASTDTNTPEDREEIQKEITELQSELDRIADTTQFNGMELLDGTRQGGFTFHIGANQGQNHKLDIASMKADALGVNHTEEDVADVSPVESQYKAGKTNEFEGDLEDYTGDALDVILDDQDEIAAVKVDGKFYALSDVKLSDDNSEIELDDATADVWSDDTENLGKPGNAANGISLSTQDDADKSISVIDAAINTVSAERSKLGATQNRLEHTINNLTATAENLAEANSRIVDVDMAEEMMEFSKANILSQASTAMLAQANQMPQGVLQLLQ